MNYTNIAIAFGFLLLIAIALKINELRKPKLPHVTKVVSIGQGRDFENVSEFMKSLPKNLKKTNTSYIANLYDNQIPENAVVLTGRKTDGTHSIAIRPAPGKAFEDRPADENKK